MNGRPDPRTAVEQERRNTLERGIAHVSVRFRVDFVLDDVRRVEQLLLLGFLARHAIRAGRGDCEGKHTKMKYKD